MSNPSFFRTERRLNIEVVCVFLLVLFSSNIFAKGEKSTAIKIDSVNLPRSAVSSSLIPLGTPEYPGLCKYRGHVGKYQCYKVKATQHGKTKKTACKGKQLYLSGGKCFECPNGYKRANFTRKMEGDPKACTKRGWGKQTKSATLKRSAYLGCPDGQFKEKGKCYSCPARTSRKHFAGIDSGYCNVEKEFRCNAGLTLHKSAPKNILSHAGNWLGLKHKKYCGQPFSLSLYSAEIVASEANKLIAQALISFGVKVAKNDTATKRKVANLKEAIKDKRLKEAYDILQSFDEFSLLEQAAYEGQQLVISVGVVGDGSIGFGANVEAGIAIDIGRKKLLFYRAHGVTKGFSAGYDVGINLGVWAGSFQTGYSQGYVVSGEFVGGAGLAVWSDYYTPKRPDGLNQPHLMGITATASQGYGFEIGEYNEVWTKVGELVNCNIESGFRLSC